MGGNPLLYRDPYGETTLAWCFGGPMGCAAGVVSAGLIAFWLYYHPPIPPQSNNGDFGYGGIPSVGGELPVYSNQQCDDSSVNAGGATSSSTGGSGSPNDDCDPNTDPNCQDVDNIWHEGTYESPKNSLEDHFARHGKEVGAKNQQQYLRQAKDFAGKLKGAKTSPVNGYTPNVTRYSKNGKYVDIHTPTKKIVSFGGK